MTLKVSESETPAGFVSVTVTLYAPTGILDETAKDPVTVPVADMEHVGTGLAANRPAVPVNEQLRALPVLNPPPVTVTVPSSVPYPGGALLGYTAIVGLATFWNRAWPALPLGLVGADTVTV
jgi:hypothetical protein